MVPGPSQQAAAFAERVRHPRPMDPPPPPPFLFSRRHRGTLAGAIHAFERALAAPAGQPDWRGSVAVRLHALRGAFDEHILLSEGTDGLYAELLAHAPRLARSVHLLTREHTAIAASMSVLQSGLERRELSIDELRDRGTDLLGELSRHRQRGADVIYEAYVTDIGGET